MHMRPDSASMPHTLSQPSKNVDNIINSKMINVLLCMGQKNRIGTIGMAESRKKTKKGQGRARINKGGQGISTYRQCCI